MGTHFGDTPDGEEILRGVGNPVEVDTPVVGDTLAARGTPVVGRTLEVGGNPVEEGSPLVGGQGGTPAAGRIVVEGAARTPQKALVPLAADSSDSPTCPAWGTPQIFWRN